MNGSKGWQREVSVLQSVLLEIEVLGGESVNRSQMDIKRRTYDTQTWKKHFSTYPPPTLIHFSHRFTSASKPAAQKSSCCLSHFRTSVSSSAAFKRP
jgi:hypothetical protein